MKLNSVSSFSPSKKVSAAKQNKNQGAAALLAANDTITFSANRKKSTSALASLLALLSLLTACNSKPANNNAAQSSAPSSAIVENDTTGNESSSSSDIIFSDGDETYITTDYNSTQEKETQPDTRRVLESIAKPTKIVTPPTAAQTPETIEGATPAPITPAIAETEGVTTAPTAPTMAIPPIKYPDIDSKEDFSGYTVFVHKKADELMESIESIDEKVEVLHQEAARLEAEAIAAEAEAKEAQEELEKAWALYYTTGEGSKEDLDNLVTSVAFLKKSVERNRKYVEGLNHVADLVAENAYHSIANPPMPY